MDSWLASVRLLSLSSVSQFRRCQAVQADNRFSGFYGEFAVYIGRNAHHEFSAERPACQWCWDRFLPSFHILNSVGYYGTDASKRSLRCRCEPTQTREFRAKTYMLLVLFRPRDTVCVAIMPNGFHISISQW